MKLQKTAMAVFLSAVCVISGCSNPFTRYVFIKPRMPELPVYERPLQDKESDISSKELTPYKTTVEKYMELIEDGNLTDEERKIILEEYQRSNELAYKARKKIAGNFDDLIVWGKKNENTIKLYNDFAEKINEESGLYESFKEK